MVIGTGEMPSLNSKQRMVHNKLQAEPQLAKAEG